MKKIALLISMILLSGCATWFPAGVQEVEEGVYTISAVGNSFASRDKMRAKINKKAESICKGRGYNKMVKEGTKWTKQKDYTSGMTTSYQTMSMTISCKDKV